MRSIVLLFICFVAMPLFAQVPATDTLRVDTLPTFTVTTGRLDTRLYTGIQPISAIDRDRIQRGQPQVSLYESLGYVPGLFAMNADNFAQDLRVSIRGFGARSAFGIRGVKILVDGIPESSPDGQAQVDNLLLGAVKRIEILRGASSGLYGNAAGGVIQLFTEDAPERPFGAVRATLGSYGLQQYQVQTGTTAGRLSMVVHGAWQQVSGFRAQSGMRNGLLNGRFVFRLPKQQQLTLLANYANSPQADDAGGLTLAEVAIDRRMSRAANRQFDAGESLQQSRFGLIWQTDVHRPQQWTAKIYRTDRDFKNTLPVQNNGVVKFQRAFTGGGVTYRYNGKIGAKEYHLTAGFDLDNQADDRQRYDNLNGKEGNLKTDQLEQFSAIGMYVLQQYHPLTPLTLELAMRYDIIKLGVEDHFLSDGDQSGTQHFNQFAPALGAAWKWSPALNLTARYAYSFETPTLNELSNNPSGAGGFNLEIGPQRVHSYEIGAKGILQKRLGYEIALFYMNVQQELVPYENNNRTFYRNAGQTDRQGIEVSGDWLFVHNWRLTAAYTFSDFIYANYAANATDFAGKTQPAVPTHLGFSELRYQPKYGLYGFLQSRFTGKMYANDANTEVVAATAVTHACIGWRLHIGKTEGDLFARANNIFDVDYFDNIRLNAAAGRYYEPAAGRTWIAGLSFTF